MWFNNLFVPFRLLRPLSFPTNKHSFTKSDFCSCFVNSTDRFVWYNDRMHLLNPRPFYSSSERDHIFKMILVDFGSILILLILIDWISILISQQFLNNSRFRCFEQNGCPGIYWQRRQKAGACSFELVSRVRQQFIWWYLWGQLIIIIIKWWSDDDNYEDNSG